MADFNDIGISRQLDWPRIKKLLTMGFLASLGHLAADFLLAWGREDESLSGVLRMLSAYTAAPDGALFAAALLGLVSITLEGLCLFGVYRLIAAKSPESAHRYRAGIFGYVIFCGCGFHVLLPAFLLFWVFFLILEITQIHAFAKGRTPYPRWCWVFSMPVGMAAAMAVTVFGNHPAVNVISCAWIAIGSLWMFGGLLAAMKKARG